MLASYLEKIKDHTGFYNVIKDHGGKLLCKLNIYSELTNQRAPASKRAPAISKLQTIFSIQKNYIKVPNNCPNKGTKSSELF